MPDSTLEWKIEFLKIVGDMPVGANFTDGKTGNQNMIWIQDMERDGYISARIRLGVIDGERVLDIPNLIYDCHVLDKGRNLIDDFESKRTLKGIWKKYYIAIFRWIITVLTAMLIGYLLRGWNLK